MDCSSSSVLSEPSVVHYRKFPFNEHSQSMTLIPSEIGQPKMSQLQSLEARMANIEVSLSSSNPGRRRKGTSLGGGTISARSSPRPPIIIQSQASPSAPVTAAPSSPIIESKELRTALQDREAVIQNLRNVLCLGKLPRPSGPPLDDTEKPAAEQKLARLKIDAENKKIAIKNLKSALDKLDITDNIDIRIRQAELEYALGREELQLLSIVEEVRALQTRLEKSKPETNSLYSIISNGINLSLHAVQATTGRWAANTKSDSLGMFIEWALDGEGLYRGDRILEINGKLITCRTKEELQKICGAIGKCQLVILRKKSNAIQHKQLAQQQEDNQRLQHRISYLEEQVHELQTTTKESSPQPQIQTPIPTIRLQPRHNQQQQQQQQHKTLPMSAASQTGSPALMNGSNNNNTNHNGYGNLNGNGSNGHVTSISISSPPSTPPEKPQIFQRGNYVTTLVGGKPIELIGNAVQTAGKAAVTTAAAAAASKSHVTKTIIKENGNHTDGENGYLISKSLSASKISVNNNSNDLISMQKREREQRRLEKALRNAKMLNSNSESINHLYQTNSHGTYHHHNSQHRSNMHARSVEHLNYNGIDRRKDILRTDHVRKFGNDLRSVKSLDFESDNDIQYKNHHHRHHQHQHHHNNHNQSNQNNQNYYHQNKNIDYTSEPVAPRIRPTPPKKPLRLSLQRAQSLQTVELLPVNDIDKKRSLKRAHYTEKSMECNLIENCSPLLTASLGRHKHI